MLRELTYGEWAVLTLYMTRFDVGSNRRLVATLSHFQVDYVHAGLCGPGFQGKN